jgi:nucleotide sugar dehydrogenase
VPDIDEQTADVCIVGLGYVGLTLATAFARAGLTVAGVERNADVVRTIAAGGTPFHEDSLDEAVADVVASGHLTAVGTDAELPRAAAYVITVGTPVRAGVVHLADLESAVERVAAGMPDGALVALRSTVRVGTTRGVALPLLQKSGRPFGLAMVPERTIEGRALAELTTLPQIVGGVDEGSAEAASRLFARLGVEIVPVGTVEAAELAKLASNTYRDIQFAFANELAYLSDAMGVDVFEVVHACNHGYARMNVALPGPVAGPCLEKDAYILADSATRFGTQAPMAMTGRRTNEALVEHVLERMSSELGTEPRRIAIMGVAFKGRPATSDVRGSMAEDFAQSFRETWPGVEVVGWDPLVSASDAEAIGIGLVGERDAFTDADAVIIQTNHPHFASAEFADTVAQHAAPGALVIDLWNQVALDSSQTEDFTMLTLGRMSAGVS